MTSARLTAREHRSEPLLALAASEIGRAPDDVSGLFRSAGQRLQRQFGMKRSPITIDGDLVTVGGIAGVLRITPTLELEVAPKFLDPTAEAWREDFFRVANLTKQGQLFSRDDVAAAAGDKNDLPSLLARQMLTDWRRNRRTPLRVYRRHQYESFDQDGDIDPQSLFLPGPDGYQQETITRDNRNGFNAVISAAAGLLIRESVEPELRMQLEQMVVELGFQPPPHPRDLRIGQVRLPARHARWQKLFELAQRVIVGFGMNFRAEALIAPGFAVRTASAWEDLLLLGLTIGFGAHSVESHRRYGFGERTDVASGRTTGVDVDPDATVHLGESAVLVDAKYKGRDESETSIDASDLYESVMFLEGAGLHRLILAYPRPGSGEPWDVGVARPFSEFRRDAISVVGLYVECRGISGAGGFARFSKNLRAAVEIAAG